MDAESDADIATRLGLVYARGRLDPWFTITGTLDGYAVRARYGGSSEGTAITECQFEPALDLGLKVTSRAFVTPEVVGRRVVRLADSNWDDELVSTADEPSRGVALLSPELRAAIIHLNIEHPGFEVRDERVVVGATLDIEAGLRTAVRIAGLVDRARHAVPCAGALKGHRAALAALAAARGLAFEATPLRLQGRIGELTVVAFATRTGDGTFALELRVSAPGGGVPSGLVVTRESVLDKVRVLLGAQDVKTGDDAFDRAFLVKAAEPGRAVRALDAEVRARFGELAACFGSIALSGDAIVVRGPSRRVPAAELARLVDAAGHIVERATRATLDVERGPYR